jgi:hypothetical protein
MRAVNGDEMYAFVVKVIADGRLRSVVQIGSPVPMVAMSLLQPGTMLPAVRPSDGDDSELMLDWQTAIADGATYLGTTPSPGSAPR